MKVGIITFQRADNYGAILQCYALYKYMSELEIEVEVVDYRNKYIERMYRGIPNFRKNVFLWLKQFVKRYVNRKDMKERYYLFDRVRALLCFSKRCSQRNASIVCDKYDVVFTGSDQVWNPQITKGLDDIYLLNFEGRFKRCAYAVSLGAVEQAEFRTEKFKKSILEIDYCSMREQDASEFLSNLLNKKIDNCVDPTLLLEREEWKKLGEQSKLCIDVSYVLLYFLDKNTDLLRIAKYISKLKGLEIICINNEPIQDASIKYISNVGPIEFISLIENAEVVVTSSFHATVFSYIFGKEYYGILHPRTGSRVKSLIQNTGLENYIYNNFADFENNYSSEAVQVIRRDDIDKKIEQSKKYIQKALVR